MHQVGGTNRAQIRISLTAHKYVFYKYLQTCFSQIPILLIARKNVFGTLMLWKFVKLRFFKIWFFLFLWSQTIAVRQRDRGRQSHKFQFQHFPKLNFGINPNLPERLKLPKFCFISAANRCCSRHIFPKHCCTSKLGSWGLSIRKKNFVICNYSFFSRNLVEKNNKSGSPSYFKFHFCSISPFASDTLFPVVEGGGNGGGEQWSLKSC